MPGGALKAAVGGIVLMMFWAVPAGAVICGFINQENCDHVCAGREVRGCKSCGVLCEECDCGDPLYPEMVCCHMQGPDCESSGIPDAFRWMSAEECDRFWGGIGAKTCPKERCGQ